MAILTSLMVPQGLFCALNDLGLLYSVLQVVRFLAYRAQLPGGVIGLEDQPKAQLCHLISLLLC